MKTKLGNGILFISSLVLFLLFSSSALAYVSLTFTSSTIPTTIEPGTKANLLLAITNAGNEVASSVKLQVRSTSSISPEQSVFEIGTLNSGASVQVVIPLSILSSSPEGTAALPFTVSYSTGSGVGTINNENSATITIVKRKLIQIIDVAYDKEVVQRGDTIRMTLAIQNLGTGNIKDLTVSIRNFTLPIAPAGTDTEKFVGTLNPADKINVSFDLIVNNNADTITYSIPVLLTYFDDQGISHSDTKYAGLKITGIPNFVVALEKEENVFAGNKGKLTVSIANVGTGTAKFLTATASSDDLEISPKTFYIGNLDPDDTNTLTYEIVSKSVGKKKLDLVLSFKDSYNKEFSKSSSVEFEAIQKPIEIPFTFQIVLLFAVLAVAYLKRNSLVKLGRRK